MLLKPLRIVIFLNAFLTLAAFVLGSFFPPVLFEWVGVTLPHSTYLAPYMLGAAQLPIGILSLAMLTMKDARSFRLLSLAWSVFHLASVLEQLHAISQGIEGSTAAWVNIALRTILGILFLYLGYFKIPSDSPVRL